MADPKMDAILEKLLERSRKGEVAWEETARENQYQVSSADTSFRIAHDDRYSSDRGYSLSVTDERGLVLESLNSFGQANEKLVELYNMARRRALGVEERLERALKGLESQGSLGGNDRPQPR